MRRMFYTLNNDDQLRAIDVEVVPTAPVSCLKEALRAESSPELDRFDADKLTLVRIFKKGKGGLTKAELKKSNDVLNEATYGEHPEDAKDQVSRLRGVPGACLNKTGLYFKVMNSMEDVSQYFSPQPERGLYYILVLVPQKKARSNLQAHLGILPSGSRISSKRRKLKPEIQPTSVNPHAYSTTQSVFELDSDYLSGSGLLPTTLVLYCRKMFHDQFRLLREPVLCDSRFGWIIGPPGTGKSATSLAFVSVMANDFPNWTVTWIHLSQKDCTVCDRFAKLQKWSFIINDIDLPYLNVFLDEIEGNHIVFLDGFVYTDDAHMSTQKHCHAWLESAPGERRLVVVCSTSSRGKTNLDDDKLSGIEDSLCRLGRWRNIFQQCGILMSGKSLKGKVLAHFRNLGLI
ncbi:hypothetical protein HDU81_011287 [Chytriomyces hyalinus]|nr:hypothetical protein HDU81_011287 [Chytriomyces hyalinus]